MSAMPYKDPVKQKAAQAKHYKDNKATYYANMVKRRTKNREYVREYKLKNPCVKCGEDEPCCLDFHHHNDDKDEAVSLGVLNWGLTRLQKEIEKCTVLCSNCHRKEHFYNR